MTSRDKILRDIRQANLRPAELPEQSTYSGRIKDNLAERFQKEVEGAGGEVRMVSGPEEAGSIIRRESRPSISWCSIKEVDLPGNLARSKPTPREVEKLDTVLIPAEFGVAENGAVWITDAVLPYRILPFITQKLAVILPEDRLVENLNEAYVRLEEQDYSFGLFVVGPSKTADIEQSLVMGAHGPERFNLFLIKGKI